MYFAISHHGLVVTPSPSQEPKNFPVGDKFSQYVVVLVVRCIHKYKCNFAPSSPASLSIYWGKAISPVRQPHWW